MRFRICIIALLWSVSTWGAPLLPNPTLHAPFLLGTWHPERENLVTAIDPFCPYCKRLLEKKDLLANYNVFWFWAPVLGAQSEQFIESTFHCDAPVSEAIFDSARHRQMPDCKGERKAKLAELNQAFYDAYQPQAVPMIYRSGQPVSLDELLKNEETSQFTTPKNTIAVQWQRYQSMTMDRNSAKPGMAWVVPSIEDPRERLKLLKKQPLPVNLYLFWWRSEKENGCTTMSPHNVCTEKEIKIYFERYQEFMLLTGSQPKSSHIVVYRDTIVAKGNLAIVSEASIRSLIGNLL